MHWLDWIVVTLAFVEGGWLAFDGGHALVTGDYVTPKLVGGPYTSMMGVFIQIQFGLRFNAPLGSAMAFSIIAICAIIVGLVALVIRRTLRAR